MFRASNDHGMKSNPTPIYSVELLKDSDDSRLIIGTHKFQKVDLTRHDLPMKRLLQIIPAPQHTIFDEQAAEERFTETFLRSLDTLKYGIAEKPVWGRKFKIRVTSNDTGRKIDINVLFDLIKKKPNEDLF